jgi:hypothetical protein
MKIIYRMLAVAGLLLALASPGFAEDTPVPLPCDPKDCPPIDPCKLAPERCTDKGGPIETSSDEE